MARLQYIRSVMFEDRLKLYRGLSRKQRAARCALAVGGHYAVRFLLFFMKEGSTFSAVFLIPSRSFQVVLYKGP